MMTLTQTTEKKQTPLLPFHATPRFPPYARPAVAIALRPPECEAAGPGSHRMHEVITGLWVAVATPLHPAGAVDREALARAPLPGAARRRLRWCRAFCHHRRRPLLRHRRAPHRPGGAAAIRRPGSPSAPSVRWLRAVEGHDIQDRGALLVNPGDKVYVGMIIGEHSRDNDLDMNPIKEKKLTNIRAAGKDEALLLTPPRRMSLEQAIAYIEDDELVEVTPSAVRLRKRYLDPHERKRFERRVDSEAAA